MNFRSIFLSCSIVLGLAGRVRHIGWRLGSPLSKVDRTESFQVLTCPAMRGIQSKTDATLACSLNYRQ